MDSSLSTLERIKFSFSCILHKSNPTRCWACKSIWRHPIFCINFETSTLFRLMIWRGEGSDWWYDKQKAMGDDFTETTENKQTSKSQVNISPVINMQKVSASRDKMRQHESCLKLCQLKVWKLKVKVWKIRDFNDFHSSIGAAFCLSEIHLGEFSMYSERYW